jgi:hypothetical protein
MNAWTSLHRLGQTTTFPTAVDDASTPAQARNWVCTVSGRRSLEGDTGSEHLAAPPEGEVALAHPDWVRDGYGRRLLYDEGADRDEVDDGLFSER